MASIVYRAKQRKWYGYFYDGNKKHRGKPLPGVPRRPKLSRLERIQAQQIADNIELESKKVSAAEIDLESAAAYWIDDCKLTLRTPTVDRYKSVLKNLIQHISPDGRRIPIASFSAGHIREWRDSRLQIRASNTVRNDIKAISAFGNWCVRNEILHKNPAEHVLAPKKIRSPQPVATNDEVLKLLDLLDDRSLPIEFRGLGIMGAMCGMRRSEILSLRWEDIHFEQNLLIVELSKSKEPRPIPMNNLVKQFLLDLPQHGPTVFDPKHRSVGSISNPAISKKFNQWLSDNGFTFSHKALRHWFVDRLRLMGLDTLARQLVAGHQDEKINALYCHPRADEARPYIERLLDDHNDLRLK